MLKPGLIRIQHSTLVILLNRHNAGFGNPQRQHGPATARSRRVCVDHAYQISSLLQDYDSHHGSAATMNGSALYNITMAATTFIADISERDREKVSNDELTALTLCLDAMKKMESVEIVARNVRKIVQTIMRVCGVQNRGDQSSSPVNVVPRVATVNKEKGFPDTSMNVSMHAGSRGNLDVDQDLMDFNFDQAVLDSVLQFPFEEALVDPTSALDFFSQ
jgi:hypothetical protein